MSDIVCMQVCIAGKVQMVGFRMWTQKHAQTLGLRGWVRNCYDGTVEALFFGERLVVEEMVQACYQGPQGALVTSIEKSFTICDQNIKGFSILQTV